MFKFPFGTMNELNLNWIIQKVKDLADATGITKEKLSFLTPNGTETFDGSEPLTVDVQGVDTSGKLDKYEGGTDSIYGTLGSNQVNFPVPLPTERGGTGVTSLTDLETSMNLLGKYVARKTTVGSLFAYGHNGSTEQEIPVEVTPAPAGIPYRDANSCVKTGTPQTDNDAATKKYTDDELVQKEATANKATTIAADDEQSTTKFPAIKAIVDWCNNKFVPLKTSTNESVYSHNGNTQGEIATASANTAGTIVKRDGNGRAQFADPAADQDAATKKWALSTTPQTINQPSSDATFANTSLYQLLSLCILGLNADIDSPSSYTFFRLFTLQNNLRPAVEIQGCCRAYNSNYSAMDIIQLTVATNGEISINCNATSFASVSQIKHVVGSIVWLTA